MGAVEEVGLEERAEAIATLSVEGAARSYALELAVQLLEVTAVSGTETPGCARDICAQAVCCGAAAVCVNADLVPFCHDRLAGTSVRVAARVTPADARRAFERGADEIEVELDRGAVLAGRYASAVDALARVKEMVEPASLTVVLETRGLGAYDELRRAALLAMMAGADFVAASPVSPPTALCVLEAIRDVRDETGVAVGFKAVGGLRRAEEAIEHLLLVHGTLGRAWLAPDRFRLASPAPLDELLRESRMDLADDTSR
jgi:deoxyribose-phosphate aldolase